MLTAHAGQSTLRLHGLANPLTLCCTSIDSRIHAVAAMQAAKLQIAPPAHLCAFVFSSPPIGSQGQMQTTLTCMFTQNIRYSMLKCLLSLCPTCRQTTMPFKGAVFHHSVFYVQMVSVSTQVTSIQVSSSCG
jgi:hypothetical protein